MGMKKYLFALGLAVAALSASATDVGVSVSVNQPGVYGRIDIGRFPQPQVVVAQPVIIQQPAVVVARPEPVYLYVPYDHRKNWRRHCHRYDACGSPVYFVQHGWYQQRLQRHDHDRRDHDRYERRDRRDRDDDRGHGKHKHKHGKHND
jgi:hypothetical protein